MATLGMLGTLMDNWYKQYELKAKLYGIYGNGEKILIV